MKIRPTDPNSTILNRVQDRREGDSGQQRQNQNQDQPKRDDGPRFEVKDADVQSAIQSFSTDKQVQASGLQAEAAGQGPGLRVVLKDGQGRFLRQMTGEEFVKLKETLADKLPHPGKLLDQKF